MIFVLLCKIIHSFIHANIFIIEKLYTQWQSQLFLNSQKKMWKPCTAVVKKNKYISQPSRPCDNSTIIFIFSNANENVTQFIKVLLVKLSDMLDSSNFIRLFHRQSFALYSIHTVYIHCRTCMQYILLVMLVSKTMFSVLLQGRGTWQKNFFI